MGGRAGERASGEAGRLGGWQAWVFHSHRAAYPAQTLTQNHRCAQPTLTSLTVTTRLDQERVAVPSWRARQLLTSLRFASTSSQWLGPALVSAIMVAFSPSMANLADRRVVVVEGGSACKQGCSSGTPVTTAAVSDASASKGTVQRCARSVSRRQRVNP